MRRARRVLCAVLAASVALWATGCWDYKETEDMLFAMGMSLDRGENGRLRSVIEISAVKGQNQMVDPEYLEVEGDTFYDVMRNSVMIADKPLNWSHIQAVVVSQGIARDDMADLLDMLLRLPQVRDSLVILVSKRATAQEIMTARNASGDLNSFNIVGSLKAEKNLQKAPYIQLYEIVDMMGDERQSATLPAVGLAETSMGKLVEVSGMAVFRGPWLQGFLDEYDTRAFILADMKQDYFDLPIPADPGGKFSSASVQIYLKRVDIVPGFADGRAKTSIYIRGEIIPVEISGASADPKKFKTVTDAIIAATSTALESSVLAMIKHTQQMGGCDILNIGYRFRKSMPGFWREANGRWRDIYNDMEIDVRAGLTLRNTGSGAQPLAKGQ
jgi:spore germination protein KC